jgi:hypothetical protein
MDERTNEKDVTEAPSLARAARRPYRAPTLKYLGSVRELTLGTSRGNRGDQPKGTKKV